MASDRMQSTTSWRDPSRPSPIFQQHLSVALASLEETWGNAEEIALPVQESGQSQCSETTALGATCFPDCISWCAEWLQRKSGNMWHHYAKSAQIENTSFKRSWRMISLLPGLAQQQLPHAKLHGPSRLSGAASCIPVIKDLLRCNLVEQWLSNPTDPAVPICYNDNVTYNHTPLKWPTIATKNVIWGDPTNCFQEPSWKTTANMQILIRSARIYHDISIVSFAALWGMLEPSGRGLTAIR